MKIFCDSADYQNFLKYKKDKIVKDFKKKKNKPKINIQRFKGLGEMNPEELWSTTLDPETRSLLPVSYTHLTLPTKRIV